MKLFGKILLGICSAVILLFIFGYIHAPQQYAASALCSGQCLTTPSATYPTHYFAADSDCSADTVNGHQTYCYVSGSGSTSTTTTTTTENSACGTTYGGHCALINGQTVGTSFCSNVYGSGWSNGSTAYCPGVNKGICCLPPSKKTSPAPAVGGASPATSTSSSASCNVYTQNGHCTGTPDGPISGTNATYIIDQCNNASKYYCFDSGKGTYYTQPNSCSTPPIGSITIPGHTFLVRKYNGVFSCVADCTLYPHTPHCTSSAPTATPTPGDNGGGGTGPTATLNLVVGLPGIGYNGPAGVTPSHSTRSVTIQLYGGTVVNPSGPGTTPLSTTQGTITYDSSSDANAGYFTGTIQVSLPSTPAANNQYEILVEVPQYLFQMASDPTNTNTPHVFTLTSGSTATTSPLILFPGDAVVANGGKNILNIDDYTQILNCFHNNSSCPTTPDGIPYADFDDNGSITIVDLNLFVRSLFGLQQLQVQPPACTGLSCQGD